MARAIVPACSMVYLPAHVRLACRMGAAMLQHARGSRTYYPFLTYYRHCDAHNPSYPFVSHHIMRRVSVHCNGAA
jgi:hypothetical protein